MFFEERLDQLEWSGVSFGKIKMALAFSRWSSQSKRTKHLHPEYTKTNIHVHTKTVMIYTYDNQQETKGGNRLANEITRDEYWRKDQFMKEKSTSACRLKGNGWLRAWHCKAKRWERESLVGKISLLLDVFDPLRVVGRSLVSVVVHRRSHYWIQRMDSMKTWKGNLEASMEATAMHRITSRMN